MSKLSQEACRACRGGEPPVGEDERALLSADVPEWELIERNGIPRLRRSYRFSGFGDALEFAYAVGRAADEQDHHPRIVLQWGKVTVDWHTHAIGGLHRNDYVMAAKCDDLYTAR